MPKVLRDRIIFNEEDWAGLDPQYGSSTGNTAKNKNRLAFARSVHPYRDIGYIQPGYAPTNVTNMSDITALPLKGVVNGSDAYIITLGDELHHFDISSETISNTGIWPRTITGATGSDIVLYNAKSGGTSALRLFYSWYDGTDGDVGVYDLSATFDDDFMSTVPTGGQVLGKDRKLPMIVGSDDSLYIGDGNSVHAYDGQEGANGTLYPDVYLLPEGYEVTCFSKTDTHLVIFAYKTSAGAGFNKGQVTAFFWDYTSLDADRIIDLSDNYVSEAFEWRGTVGCFTWGRRTSPTSNSNPGKIQVYSFESGIFEILHTFSGNPPVRGGVEVTGDIIQWNTDGSVYQFGTNFEGQKDTLNQTNEGTGTTSGLLASFSTTTLYIASSATTLQSIDSGFYNQSIFETNLAEPNFDIGKRGKVEEVKLRFKGTASGGRTFSLFLSDRSSNLTTVMSAQSTIAAGDIVTVARRDSSGNPLPKFDALKIVGQWQTGSGSTAAPVLSEVEIRFSQIAT